MQARLHGSSGRCPRTYGIVAFAVCCARLVLVLLGAAAPSPAEGATQWSPITGSILVRGISYFEESEREDRDQFGEAELRAQILAQLTSKLQLTLNPLVQADTADKTAGELELHEDGLQRPAVTFEELHLTYYGSKFEIGVGKQLFTWGVADGFRPTDTLNAVDFLDVPTARKLGAPAVSLFRYGNKVDAHLVLLPAFTPHRLPGLGNRWVVLPRASLEQLEQLFGTEPIIEIERSLPATTLGNLQGGLRLSSSSLVNGWDLELSLFHGFDPFGVFNVTLAPPTVNVNTIYPEFRQIGGGFSTTTGRLEVHGEVGYHDTLRAEEDDDYLQYVAGINLTFDSGISAALERILLVLEYVGETITHDRSLDGVFLNTGFNRVLTNTTIVRTDFTFSERTTIGIGGTVNFDDGDWGARLQLTQKLFGALELETGVDVLEGDAESFYGNWDDNDRFFLFATYFF